jgi:hypothetical protein
MDISPFEQWKLRYIIHLAIYLNLNSPTDFFDEAYLITYLFPYIAVFLPDVQGNLIDQIIGLNASV